MSTSCEKSPLTAILSLLTNNLLTADEFQRIFQQLSPTDRMTLLQRLDQTVSNQDTRH